MVAEITQFLIKQARSCIFPVAVFFILAVSNYIVLPGLARYDFIFISLLLFQLLLIAVKYETFNELKIVFAFHLIGLVFEVVKVNTGAWAYPESAVTKVLNVPLYSGFMYASVASYIVQAERNLKLKYTNWPGSSLSIIMTIVIYLNFLLNRILPDIRVVLLISLVYIFRNTYVVFRPLIKNRRMPMLLAFLLISIFVWIAENISTFFKAWVYPHQQASWASVDLKIVSSWFLLVVMIMILTRQIKNSNSDQSNKK